MEGAFEIASDFVGNKTDEEGLDVVRRKILDALAALIIVERKGPTKEWLRENSPRSRLFYTAVKEICTSFLECDNDEEDTPEKLLRDLFWCAHKESTLGKSDWMPECWAVCVSGVEPNVAIELLDKKNLPKALNQDGSGVSMMHMAASCRRFSANLMDVVSSPSAARSKDKSGQLPLHWAAAQSHSIPMLDYLLALYPGATREQDNEGMTPIAALVNQFPFPGQVEMFKHLARADPESCSIISDFGKSHLFSNFATMAGYRSKRGQDAALEDLFNALLEVVPREYLLEADSLGSLPLHLICQHGGASAYMVSALIRACPESQGGAVKCLDNHGNSPVKVAVRGNSVSLEVIRLLIDAYPEGVDLFDLLFSQPLQTQLPVMFNMIESHVSRFPGSVQKINETWGYLPLHSAIYYGDFKLVKFIFDKYPDAVKHFCKNGRLPLHIALENYNDDRDTKLSSSEYDNVTFFLCRRYPQAASMKKVFGDDEQEDEEDQPWMTQTPIEYAIDNKLPSHIQRLLLCACPEVDEQRWRKLNYEARRGAMFLAFSAISRQHGPESLVWQLRRLMRLDKDMPLLRHIISFL